MARGEKLNLFLGDNSERGWALIDDLQHEEKRIYLEPQKHQLFFKREKRRGKVVTLVGPFWLQDEIKKELLKELKRGMGVGGKAEKGWMEFQGELNDRLCRALTDKGYRFKLGHCKE